MLHSELRLTWLTVPVNAWCPTPPKTKRSVAASLFSDSELAHFSIYFLVAQIKKIKCLRMLLAGVAMQSLRPP